MTGRGGNFQGEVCLPTGRDGIFPAGTVFVTGRYIWEKGTLARRQGAEVLVGFDGKRGGNGNIFGLKGTARKVSHDGRMRRRDCSSHTSCLLFMYVPGICF